jgi:hypothetical protein
MRQAEFVVCWVARPGRVGRNAGYQHNTMRTCLAGEITICGAYHGTLPVHSLPPELQYDIPCRNVPCEGFSDFFRITPNSSLSSIPCSYRVPWYLLVSGDCGTRLAGRGALSPAVPRHPPKLLARRGNDRPKNLNGFAVECARRSKELIRWFVKWTLVYGLHCTQ